MIYALSINSFISGHNGDHLTFITPLKSPILEKRFAGYQYRFTIRGKQWPELFNSNQNA